MTALPGDGKRSCGYFSEFSSDRKKRTLIEMTFRRVRQSSSTSARGTAGRAEPPSRLFPLPRCSKATRAPEQPQNFLHAASHPLNPLEQIPPAKPHNHLADTGNRTARRCAGSVALTQRAPAPAGGLLRPSLAAPGGGGGGAAGGGGSSCGSLQPLRSASPPGRSPRRWVPRCSPRGLVQREQMLPGC